ncbi:hypothetical protein GCM10027048_37820 [Hymenobacter coalescens]
MTAGICVLLGLLILRVVVQRFVPFPRYHGPGLLAAAPAELMPEADFWLLVDAARGGLATDAEQLATLGETLARLDTVQIRRFNRTLRYLLRASDDADLAQAAAAVNGSCNAVSFEYFRGWLIAQGRDKFYWTLRHPRLLLLSGRAERVQGYEGLGYVAPARYRDQTGRRLPAAPKPAAAPRPAGFDKAARWRYPELWLLVW